MDPGVYQMPASSGSKFTATCAPESAAFDELDAPTFVASLACGASVMVPAAHAAADKAMIEIPVLFSSVFIEAPSGYALTRA
jgi:hypothetical protein